MRIVLLLTTLPDAETAARMARVLVEERLAACVQLIGPIRSVYRWQSRIEESGEVQLLAKTTVERVEALRQRLTALHPYELPEIVTFTGEASAAYGDWVVAETSA